jgi:predicted P-loop ATPase
MSEKKTRQDEIKDVGGFVGGYVNNGRRKAENITHRQLITLDIDFAKGDIWDDFAMQYGCAAAIYSTHKHSADNQRLRLIVPLDRPVGTDQYIAIARRLADTLDINTFDDTTYEPSRLMYWPSTAKDAVFVFNYQDGPWLNADEVLSTYKNWQDASEWPVSDRAGEIINHAIKKQGDPLEKPGVVGAFCRTYSIAEAIEQFLDDQYVACGMENRYTFKEGSTAAGLVVYDDKYSFSHHGTDPTSGKLCNSFDLVRLHLFGLQDEDAKEGTPGNKLPSYTSMIDFASKDKPVKKLIGIERLQDAKGDFSEMMEDSDGEPEDMDWLEGMDVDGKGKYKSTIDNIRVILDNDPRVKGKLALNKFEQREIATGDLPWRKIEPKNPYLTDKDDAGLRHYLEKTYDLTGIQKITDGLSLTVEKNAFHPVRDYLNSVSWDQEERLDTLTVDYMGVADTTYTRATTRKAFVGAVTRIFRPGCKFDYVLTSIGKQGVGKSTLLKKLGKQWFSDSFTTVQGKEAFEQIQGVWIMELAELAQLKKAELEAVKHFITKQDDRFRVAYGKRVENFPRQCAFFGTDNNKDFLRDPTGNRRFWPQDAFEFTPKKDVFTDLDDYEIDQIWAEAMFRFKAGETLFLSKELEEEARQMQSEHTETDERAGVISKFLDTPLPTNWEDKELYDRRVFWGNQGEELGEKGKVQRQRVCIAELWVELFAQKQSEMNKFNTKDLHNIMRNMDGWGESKYPVNVKVYGRQRVYRRVPQDSKIGIHEVENTQKKGQFGIHEQKGQNTRSIHEVYTKI